MSPGGGDGESKNGATFPPIRQSITPQAYWRSAPVRRLRHPLEEAPIWGILCTLLGEIVTFLIGVPVLALLLPVLVIAKITRVIIHCRQRERTSSDSSGLTYFIFLIFKCLNLYVFIHFSDSRS